jgi:hypothetical protein
MSTMSPPLTTSMTTPLTTSSRFFSLFDGAPRLLVLGALLGQDEATLLVLLLQDQALDALAERDDLGGVDVVADRELAGRDDALGLEADVEQDLVAVDLDDGALDQVAVFELEDAVAHQGGEVGADHVVFGDDARDVVAVFVEGAHLLGGEEAGAVRHAYSFHATTPGSARE